MRTLIGLVLCTALWATGCGDDDTDGTSPDAAGTDGGRDSSAPPTDGGGTDTNRPPRDAGPPPDRQLVASAGNPRVLFYDDGSPHYLCGPGDPEGFLYRGTRQADGTRGGDQMALIAKLSGTGANGIYLQSIRSHGGDGGSDHNPFVDSDPAMGLDDDILDQWDTWFSAMDAAGIVVYFFVFDDSACVWDCSADAVPAEEQAYLEAIVGRFQHIGHLVWVIAEEYSERFSAARASAMAAVIRAADDFDHPIGVHKLDGSGFSEFEDDPNVDQFTMQTTAADADGLHSNVLDAVARSAGLFNVNMAEGHIGGSDHGTGAAGRTANWAVAMTGAYVMALGWDIESNSVEDLEQCGHLVRFMESTRFDTMQPNDALALGDTDYVLTNPDDRFILYSANASGDLGVMGVGDGTYDLTWVNPIDGTTVDETSVALSGDSMLTPPAGMGAEVAVHIRRAM